MTLNLDELLSQTLLTVLLFLLSADGASDGNSELNEPEPVDPVTGAADGPLIRPVKFVIGDVRTGKADEVVVVVVVFRMMSSSLEHGSVDEVPEPLLLLLLHPLPQPLLLLIPLCTACASLPNDPDRVWNWKDANSRKSGTRDSDPVPPVIMPLPLLVTVLQADAAADDPELWMMLLLLL